MDKNGNGNREIFQACSNGELENVKDIFEKDPNRFDTKYRDTARKWNLLHVASWEGQTDIVCFLLQTGFSNVINDIDRDGDTALHLASTTGRDDVCSLLLKAGADVMVLNQKGNTAFHQACKLDSSAICVKILEVKLQCLRMQLKNKTDGTPQVAASKHNIMEDNPAPLEEGTVCFLADETSQNLPTSKIDKMEVSGTLLEKGADCTVTDEGGDPGSCLLHEGDATLPEAFKPVSADVCAQVFECKLKYLNMKNKAGETPLLLASMHDKMEVGLMLLEEGADCTVTDEGGDTALHFACQRSSLELCRALVEKGVECLSKTNKKSETALHKAAERNDPELCRLLLDAGCDFTIVNDAIQISKSRFITEEIWEKQNNTVLHIVANTIDAKHQDNAGVIGKMLIEKGADWSQKNNHGDTALHIAARKVNVQICELLVNRGADCLVQNKLGNTPWDLVPKTRQFKLDVLKTVTDKARYSKLMEESGSTPVKTVKLFICGNPAAGKTTLKRSLSKGRLQSRLPRWRFPTTHIATPGVNVKSKHIRGAGWFVIWDMAGQIEYHVTHAMLLGASKGIFVVVFDMTKPEEENRKQVKYWLSFIKAGHDPSSEMKPSIVVVGTHIDNFRDADVARRVSDRILDEIIQLFKAFLDIHFEVVLIDGRHSMSRDITRLKGILKSLAQPLREGLTPNICANIVKRMSSWSKAKLPIMYFPEFLRKVNAEVDPLANERLVRLAVGYLHETGELHCAKVKQQGGEDLIILNPNWLTTTIFGPIFATPEFRPDYQGLDEKQVYKLEDLKVHFSVQDPKLLVDLLEYFELAYKRDDSSFIIPVKLPPGVTKIDWTGHDRYSNHYGLRIECRDQTDMFTVDTFPCLQVRAMNEYKQEDTDPKLSRFGLKVCDDVEGMIQLSSDKRAIHIAIRVKEGEHNQGRKQLQDMKEMVNFELSERSIGTRVNVCYLSPTDMRASMDLEANVRFYTEETVENAKKRNKPLRNPETLVKETIESVTAMHKKDVFGTIESLDPSLFLSGEYMADHIICVEEDEALQDLAKHIGNTEWESLGRYLGVKNSEIHGIKCTHQGNEREQIFQMLLKWRQSQTKDKDKEDLLKKALVKAERLDLAHGVSASAEVLNDLTLKSIIKQLDTAQWETLAIMLGCTPEEINFHETTTSKSQVFSIFVKWRRRQPKNIDVVRYMTAGLRHCEREDLALQLEKISASPRKQGKMRRFQSYAGYSTQSDSSTFND